MAAKLTPLRFLLLLLSFLFPPKAFSTLQQEAQTLLQLKLQWGNPSALASWSTSSTSAVCAWAGVQCNDANSTVAGLSLSALNLTGDLPASVCDLRNLTDLDLSANDLGGGFPTALYNCSAALSSVDLSENLFVGPLPSDIDRLPAGLVDLDLSSNNFTGDIPPSIGRLPSIQTLYLHYNLFNGTVPAEMSNLSTLSILGLANNPFTPAALHREWGNMSSLGYLWMTTTGLTGEIPESFGSLTRLNHLDLSENSLTGRIPDSIWNVKTLQYLYLFKNSLSGEINVTTIGAAGLARIDVSINQLEGPIPAGFGELKNLSVLLMYFNRFSGEIPPSIGRLPSLTDLRLFNNSLTGPLPPDLGKHSPLWNVEVDDNRLSGGLPEGLCAGGGFESLVVFNNNFSGEIPASLASCATLNNLQIQSNNFSGELPAGIWSAVNLTTVIANDNLLSGELPASLPWNLTRLQIHNNRFSGEVPSAAGNLLVFTAANNGFSGELPASFSGISNLQSLDLGGNRISGGIPPAISELASLTDLDLSGNRISGEIPREIGSLPVLTSLDLSENQLSGEIPPSIGNLRLNFLNLSGNDLSGEIPATLETPIFTESFESNPKLCSARDGYGVSTCGKLAGGGGSGKLSSGIRIMIAVLGALLLLTVVAFAALVVRDRRRRKTNGSDLATWKLTSFQSLDFTESSIVKGLAEENLIGSGGSGKVYRVAVGNRTGAIVAVKRIWNGGRTVDPKLEGEFQSEVKILGSIRHVNIVKLLCCISSVDSKMLVYEHMENGSLDRWLHEKRRVGAPAGARSGNQPLDWGTRVGIAVGAAQGLSYMHHDCSPPVVHRDVKSSNILLDSEFRARIADFGLAKLLVRTSEPEMVSAVAGSFGYMAPECAYTRKVNEKVDVYSFGVVLLELTTGREANEGGEQGSLAEWAWRHVQEGNKLVDAIDESIRHPSNVEEIAMVFKLGIICTGTLPSTRPTMKEVVEILLRCDRTQANNGYKPQVDHDVAPLLQPKRGSRHKRQTSPKEDSDDCDGLACSV